MIKLNKEFLEKLKPYNLKRDLTKLIMNISFRDVVIFLTFPIFITFLMFLPVTSRELLSFHIYNVKIWQYFTHAFIHKNSSHLGHNLYAYFLFGIPLFIFANKIKEKKNLFLLFLFTLLTLPLISSILEILIYPRFLPMIKTSQGSSGIISAMIGFLPMFWIYYLSKKQKTDLMNSSFVALSSLWVLLLFAIIYYPIHKNLFFILLIAILILFSSFLYRKNFKLILRGILDESKDNVIFYFLTTLLPAFFMLAPLLLFPSKIIQGDSLVDFFMHYISLFYGISISFVFLKWKLHHS